MGHRHTAPLKNPQPCSSPPNVAKAGSDVLHIEYERERLFELACPEDPGTAPFSLAPAGDSFLSTQLLSCSQQLRGQHGVVSRAEHVSRVVPSGKAECWLCFLQRGVGFDPAT